MKQLHGTSLQVGKGIAPIEAQKYRYEENLGLVFPYLGVLIKV
jgi:hypothetical protein